jgi:hypothetical protein
VQPTELQTKVKKERTLRAFIKRAFNSTVVALALALLSRGAGACRKRPLR